jgi:glycosyltransferase involved in cell wall biosynthesis
MTRSRPLVLHVTHELGAGGAELLVYELVSRLPSKEYDAQAVTVLGGGSFESMFHDNELPLHIFSRKGFFGIGTIIDLYRLFKRERPMIVHTHLFLADTWGRIAARLVGVPHIVSTEHNVNPSYGSIKRLVNRILSKITDVHIAVSKDVKRVMIQKDHVDSKKIRVIVNGIDLERVIQRGARPFHDLPRFIVVGRLASQKDHATLLKALALVKRPWRLQIVGTGELEGQLRNLAERLHIASRVEWLGFRDRDSIPALFSEADVFFFPSKYEGLGLAAIEAAAAGVPIIASDLQPLRELLGDDDVRYFSSGDVSELAKAINETLNDPVSSVLKAARAVPKIRAQVSIERMVEQYAKIYEKLLK